ncbi:DNA glycosylase [Microstroma glucosiphilum]|uniref:DNA glycosylase n=1 Tax=Pseudomicrostroma glucosiphilum TaxID=1684307 RepID=A0A316U3J1_9BASI|nr:DNA glycosylase [Pseudomicrostroma glucosiphilum]PWN19866.1 DNA glycosylase [Pseudomicrostroma glucosiphilum]
MPPTTRGRTTVTAVPPKPADNVKSAAVSDSSTLKATPAKARASKKRPLSQAFPASKASTSLGNGAPSTKSPKRKAATAATAEEAPPPLPALSEDEVRLCTTIPFPRLTFSLREGTEHLIKADPRFRSLLRRIPLRVFEEFTDEHLEQETAGGGDDKVQPRAKDLDLFKTLVTSILGQQVSWLAARSILYKFTRLWFPELPVVPDFSLTPRDSLPFPTPLQVRSAGEGMLRSAGLSGQKVRYVTDIAERFSDGRLDVRKIVEMNEEQVLEELIKIKGVGVWTAQMLLLFALRRPNILPVGDLGVQRGMVLLWASGPEGPPVTSKKARPPSPSPEPKPTTAEAASERVLTGDEAAMKQREEAHKVEDAVESSEHHVARTTGSASTTSLTATTPTQSLPQPPPLPADAKLTLAQLNARKSGQKAKGNVYLTPPEMEALAKTWEPYRSLASVIVWALVDA